MAYTMKGPGQFGATVYNVERPTGKSGANLQSDVKLVQYMLRHIYGDAASGMKIDGIAGPITNSWILRFQKECKSNGSSVQCDGTVDRAFGEVSAISNTTYTILLMNQELKQRNPGAFANLPSSVPLNSEPPAASPYNPRAKRVIDYEVKVLENGVKEVTYKYSDGTQEKTRVAGDVMIGGRVVHTAQLISFWSYKQYPWEYRFYQYADGRVEQVKEKFVRVPVANVPQVIGGAITGYTVVYNDGGPPEFTPELLPHHKPRRA